MTDFVGSGIEYHNQAVTLLHGGSYALFQAFLIFFRNNHLVDDYFDVVVLVSVEFHAVHDFTYLTVHSDIEITFLAYLLEKFLVMTFTGTDQRSQQIDALSLVLLMNHVENLFFGILHHFLSRKIRIGDAGSGEKQTKVVVDFGGSAYGGTWILVGSLLFNGDDRTQTGNLVHIRTLHSSQEIAGIGREGFDVSPLSFRKDGIESQG